MQQQRQDHANCHHLYEPAGERKPPSRVRRERRTSGTRLRLQGRARLRAAACTSPRTTLRSKLWRNSTIFQHLVGGTYCRELAAFDDHAASASGGRPVYLSPTTMPKRAGLPPPICLTSCRRSSAAVRRPRCCEKWLTERSTTSFTSTTAPRTMRGLRRIMSSHAGAWTTTGVPGITTRSILCAIAKCSSSPPTRKASSLSTSPWTDVNRQARLYQEGLGVGETPPTQPP